jgi:hypothetical protein
MCDNLKSAYALEMYVEGRLRAHEIEASRGVGRVPGSSRQP